MLVGILAGEREQERNQSRKKLRLGLDDESA